MLMPSETVMVPKMMALPPAALAPTSDSRASASMCILQGVTIDQVEAMPTMGFLKSASLKPTGRSIARAPARLGPSTRTEECWRVGSEEEEELMVGAQETKRPRHGQARSRAGGTA